MNQLNECNRFFNAFFNKEFDWKHFNIDIKNTAIKTFDDIVKIDSLLPNFPDKTCLEIGTCQGVSTAFLATKFEKVYTIDVVTNPERQILWEMLGITDKIISFVVRDNAGKEQLVKELSFNFAFIDGLHIFDEVKLDFELCKKCGYVLFHDYEFWPEYGRFQDIKKFVDTLDQFMISLAPPFAAWKEAIR